MWSTTKIAEAAAGVSALVAVATFLIGAEQDRDKAREAEMREWAKVKAFRLIDTHPNVAFAELRKVFEADEQRVRGSTTPTIAEEDLNRVLLELAREHLILLNGRHQYRVVTVPNDATPAAL